MQTESRDSERLAALEDCRILDSITRLAAQFFGAPIAVISLVDRDRVCFKSRHGIDMTGATRDASFCAQAILSRDPLVVPDAARDARFAGLPMVCGPPAIRFYAGMPLVSGEFTVGTLAVMDVRPREPFTEAQRDALRDFAALASQELERRTNALDQPAPVSSELPDGIAGALPAMVWVTDTAGHCTLLNGFRGDAAAPDYAEGQTRERLGAIPAEDRDPRSKADLTFECRIPGADGKDRWILEQARPRFHADGSFAGYLGLCLDVTGRKQTEEALRNTQDWLALGQNAAGIGFWDWDLVTDTCQCSDQYFRLYGIEPRSPFRFADWQELLHPDDRRPRQVYDARGGPAGDAPQSDFRCIWPDGSVHWLHSRAKICRDEAGRAVRIIGANIDISGCKEAEERRNQAEEELLASREQLRQLAAYVESVREQERIRIAREIHDELGQILTALKMDLEAVAARYRASVSHPRQEITSRITSMLAHLDLSIGTVQRISAELRPGVLDHLGIAAAIEWQLQEFESRTGIRCHAEGLAEQLPLNADQSTAVFRIFQEILTNIGRHAGATAVTVEVEMGAGQMTLRVMDNGKGLDKMHLADPEALGLLGMRERALLLGGRIDFESGPRAGTAVILEIPVSGLGTASAQGTY